MNLVGALAFGWCGEGDGTSNAARKAIAKFDGKAKRHTLRLGRGMNVTSGKGAMVGQGLQASIPAWLKDPMLSADVKSVLRSDLAWLTHALESTKRKSLNCVRGREASLGKGIHEIMDDMRSLQAPSEYGAGLCISDPQVYNATRYEALKSEGMLVGGRRCDFKAVFADGASRMARILSAHPRATEVRPSDYQAGDVVAYIGSTIKEASDDSKWKKVALVSGSTDTYEFVDTTLVNVPAWEPPERDDAWRYSEAYPTHSPPKSNRTWEFWARIAGMWRPARILKKKSEKFKAGDSIALLGYEGKNAIVKRIQRVAGHEYSIIEE